MTTTEERLADALHAVARSVQDDRLTPLQAPARPARRWGRLLAPAAAAAAVGLIVAVVALVVPGAPHHAAPSGTTTTPVTGPAGPPRFYVDLGIQVEIRSTATSAITATIPTPRLNGRKNSMIAVSVAAEASDRAFIIAFTTAGNPPAGQLFQTILYRAVIGHAGQLTGFSPIPYGVVDGFAPSDRGTLAISPDGADVAFLACPASADIDGGCGWPKDIIVISPKGNRLWHGGLPTGKSGLNLLSVSWQPSGQGLVFLAAQCQTYQVTESGACSPGDNHAEVRTLRLGTENDSLAQGKVLLTDSSRYPNIVQAVLTPGGSSLTMLVGHGPSHGLELQDMQIVRVPLRTGGPSRVLYRGQFYEQDPLELSPDSSGRYWLLVSGVTAWFDHGALHKLHPYYMNDMLAW
jgi:hypothetical protein